MAKQDSFFRIGAHRRATITVEPELINIKYVDTSPADNVSPMGVIVLVHGWPESSYQFRNVIGPLSRAGYRVITPDYTGTGESSRPIHLDRYSKVNIASDLHKLIHDHLGIKDKIHIVGHDIGGMIAHAYAASFPHGTASIVWGECPLPGTAFYQQAKDSLSLFHFNFHRVLDLPETLLKGNERAYIKHFFDNFSYNATAITSEDFDFYAQQYSQPGAIRGSINVYRLFEQDAKDNIEMREKDGKCGVRCLTLNGDKSPLKAPVEGSAKEFYESPKTASVEDAMHYVAEENPQAFAREVLKFVGQA